MDSNLADAIVLEVFLLLLAAGVLMLLLELSAQRSDFHTALGGGSWTPTLPMTLSLKYVFYLLTAGLLLSLLLVLLGLSA